MIALTCWSCGWEGRVRDRYAGLRVACKRCGAETTAPGADWAEAYIHRWTEAEAAAVLASDRADAPRRRPAAS